MPSQPHPRETLPRPLGGGLVLRYAKPDDTERLVEFFMRIFAEDEDVPPDPRLGQWVRDLLTLEVNPLDRRDGMLVEEESTGRLASALVSLPQRWTYAGVPLLVGRPEPVATDKDFRKRGLVRALFDEFHKLSAARGDLLQCITGIPWFYRQFGYEMTVEFGGSHCGYEAQVKTAAAADKRGCSLRPAEAGDIPFLMDVYNSGSQRYLMRAALDESWWLNEIARKHPDNMEKADLSVLLDAEKHPAGFCAVSHELDGKGVLATNIEVRQGLNWRDYMPLVIEHTWAVGQSLATATKTECNRFAFGLGSQHPAYLAAAEYLPEARKPYNWYLRVPDLPVLINRLAPVLEARMAASPFAGHDGTLKIAFYKKDMHLVFKAGKLESTQTAPASAWHAADVCFPDQTFLHLLFGYRSSAELAGMFADCRVSAKYVGLLDALFPKQPSFIVPME